MFLHTNVIKITRLLTFFIIIRPINYRCFKNNKDRTTSIETFSISYDTLDVLKKDK